MKINIRKVFVGFLLFSISLMYSPNSVLASSLLSTPTISVAYVGLNNDDIAVQVEYDMPPDAPKDAYGFVLDKEGTAGRVSAGIFYPGESGYYDLTDGGYYFDETVACDQNYKYYIKAFNRSGEESDWALATITPKCLEIKNIQVTDIAANSAKVSWKTDVETKGTVEYGENTSYGQTKEDTELKTDHSVILADLKENTTYHFRIKAYVDNPDDAVLSDDQTFETTNISCNPKVADRWQTGIRFWTNQTGLINFIFNGQQRSIYANQSGYFDITGLQSFTAYTYQVEGCGLVSKVSTRLTFVYPIGIDWNSHSNNGTSLYWHTDLPNFGKLVLNSQEYPSPNFGTAHTAYINFSDLEPNTQYCPSVVATNGDAYDDRAWIYALCFWTPPENVSMSSASLESKTIDVTNNLITSSEQNTTTGDILFTTAIPANTMIEYGLKNGTGTKTQQIEAKDIYFTEHPVKLKNLKSRTYRYKIIATDENGKQFVSQEYALKHGNRFVRFWGDLWEKVKSKISRNK